MKKPLIALAILIALAATGAVAQAPGHPGGGSGRGAYAPSGGFERGGAPDRNGYRGGGGYRPQPTYDGRGYGPQGYPGGASYAYGPAGREGGGYRGFTRGQFLPPAYGRGAVIDPRQYHLRRPPNGYGWVTVGPNAYLTQRSTGLILDTAPLY